MWRAGIRVRSCSSQYRRRGDIALTFRAVARCNPAGMSAPSVTRRQVPLPRFDYCCWGICSVCGSGGQNGPFGKIIPFLFNRLSFFRNIFHPPPPDFPHNAPSPFLRERLRSRSKSGRDRRPPSAGSRDQRPGEALSRCSPAAAAGRARKACAKNPRAAPLRSGVRKAEAERTEFSVTGEHKC